MKNEIYLTQNLQSLENDFWPSTDEESHLITSCHQLRKKPLKDFEMEDLRLMIGQDIGLKYLVPLALKALNNNILANGDFYKGDLLSSVVNSDKEFWKQEKELFIKLEELIFQNSNVIKENASEQMDTFKELKNELNS